MLDVIYIAIVVLFFVGSWAFTKACERLYEGQRMDYIIAGIAALFLFGYLIYALLRPEKF